MEKKKLVETAYYLSRGWSQRNIAKKYGLHHMTIQNYAVYLRKLSPIQFKIEVLDKFKDIEVDE